MNLLSRNTNTEEQSIRVFYVTRKKRVTEINAEKNEPTVMPHRV
jgi:hypothetical protein